MEDYLFYNMILICLISLVINFLFAYIKKKNCENINATSIGIFVASIVIYILDLLAFLYVIPIDIFSIISIIFFLYIIKLVVNYRCKKI